MGKLLTLHSQNTNPHAERAACELSALEVRLGLRRGLPRLRWGCARDASGMLGMCRGRVRGCVGKCWGCVGGSDGGGGGGVGGAARI